MVWCDQNTRWKGQNTCLYMQGKQTQGEGKTLVLEVHADL
jgi:hypothetical protein